MPKTFGILQRSSEKCVNLDISVICYIGTGYGLSLETITFSNKYIYLYLYFSSMTSKMISVKEEIYNRLSQLKHENESFSDLFERLLLSRKKNPLKIYEISPTISDDDNDIFEKAIQDSRELRRVQSLERRKKYEEEI